jgi:hypothetical protein
MRRRIGSSLASQEENLSVSREQDEPLLWAMTTEEEGSVVPGIRPGLSYGKGSHLGFKPEKASSIQQELSECFLAPQSKF